MRLNISLQFYVFGPPLLGAEAKFSILLLDRGSWICLRIEQWTAQYTGVGARFSRPG